MTPELLRALPKTDLHNHLDGSLRPETMIELADAIGHRLPADTPDRLVDALSPPNGADLTRYLQSFEHTLAVMSTYEAVERIAFEVAQDAAQETVRYLEVRFCPMLLEPHGLSSNEVVSAVKRGLIEAEKRYFIRTGIIICGLRNLPEQETLRMARLAVEMADTHVLAYDLAGGEADHPVSAHRQAFETVAEAQLNCTIHAGEAAGPESVKEALSIGRAHRIGHGTRLRSDPMLMQYVNDHRIPVEVCLTSNIQTGAAPNFADHPFRYYYDMGLRVTLNTDNTLISHTNMTREYELAVEHYGMDLTDLRQISINGIKSAFLNYHDRKVLIQSMLAEFDTFTQSETTDVVPGQVDIS